MITRALAEAGIDADRLKVAVELGSTEAARRAVEAGAGLSFLSCYALRPGDVPSRVRVLRVSGMDTRRPLFVAVERGRAARPAGGTLLQYLSSAEVRRRLSRWRTEWRRAQP